MSETHKVTITFLMEEMTGTPEESAEVLLDVYIPDECTFHVDNAWKVAVSETVLDNWSIKLEKVTMLYGDPVMRLHLRGDVTGHPKLEDGLITTSPVWGWRGRTVNTRNTTYLLGGMAE